MLPSSANLLRTHSPTARSPQNVIDRAGERYREGPIVSAVSNPSRVWEQYDIALSRDALDAAAPFITALRSSAVHRSIAKLADTTPEGRRGQNTARPGSTRN